MTHVENLCMLAFPNGSVARELDQIRSVEEMKFIFPKNSGIHKSRFFVGSCCNMPISKHIKEATTSNRILRLFIIN